MQTATEHERKYDVPPDFTLPQLDGAATVARVDAADTHELDATYFDTADLRLIRHRRTLRRRTGGTDAGWHLKTPGDGTSRTEHRLPLTDRSDRVPDELLAEVRAIVRSAALRPVARLHTRRAEFPLRDSSGTTLALLAWDEVRADADGGQQRWTELEVELVEGGPAVLRAIEKRLLTAGATRAAGPSKLGRVLADRLASTAPRSQPAGSGPTAQPKPPGRTVAAVLRYVRDQRDAIIANDPGVRHGDDEAIHRMRVATRRLRSSLRTYRGLWGDTARGDRLRDELTWLAQRLGGVRDGQVMAARFAAAVEHAGADAAVADRIRRHLDTQVRQGRSALTDALDADRYLRLLDALDEFVDSAGPPAGATRGTAWVRRRARKAVRRAEHLLAAAEEQPPAVDPDGTGGPAATDHGSGHDERLHEARKAYKRARYAVEACAATAGKPAKRLVQRLTGVQDLLGEYQDSVVARHLLRQLADAAHAHGEPTFDYGVLYARQQDAGQTALAALPLAR